MWKSYTSALGLLRIGMLAIIPARGNAAWVLLNGHPWQAYALGFGLWQLLKYEGKKRK